jgi:tetratricopeptide (TPR) repeat protein
VIGIRLYDARRYNEAIQQLHHTLEMNRHFFPAILFLAMAYQQVGLHAEAVELLQEEMQFSGSFPVSEAALAFALASADRQREAEAALSRLLERSEAEYVSAFQIAIIFLALDRIDEAFAWLERSLEERSPWMSRLKIEPLVDPIRSDDRFAELLRHIGVEGFAPSAGSA